jgi:hypothetical protein
VASADRAEWTAVRLLPVGPERRSAHDEAFGGYALGILTPHGVLAPFTPLKPWSPFIDSSI